MSLDSIEKELVIENENELSQETPSHSFTEESTNSSFPLHSLEESCLVHDDSSSLGKETPTVVIKEELTTDEKVNTVQESFDSTQNQEIPLNSTKSLDDLVDEEYKECPKLKKESQHPYNEGIDETPNQNLKNTLIETEITELASGQVPPQPSWKSQSSSIDPTKYTVHFECPPERRMTFPPESRLFVGRLAVEKITREELAEIFGKYGNIWEIALKASFGFIQFDNPEACQNAILYEQGRLLGGLNIDLNLSNDKPKPRREFGAGRGSGKFERDRRSTSDRSRPYNRSSHRDSRSPSPRKRFPRDDHPPPKRYGTNIPTCQIVILGDVERRYITDVESALRRGNVSFDTMHLGPKLSLQTVVEDLKHEGVLAILFLNINLEKSRRVAMQYYRGGGDVQEYQSILPEAAVDIINSGKYGRAQGGQQGQGVAQGGAGLDPNTIAALAQMAQARGQQLDPNTIAALSQMAAAGSSGNIYPPSQDPYSSSMMQNRMPGNMQGQMQGNMSQMQGGNIGQQRYPPQQNQQSGLAALLSSYSQSSIQQQPQQHYPPNPMSFNNYQSQPQQPHHPQPQYHHQQQAQQLHQVQPQQSYGVTGMGYSLASKMPSYSNQSAPTNSGKTESVSDILNRLKTLADLQRR